MNKSDIRHHMRFLRRSFPIFHQQLAAVKLALQIQNCGFLQAKINLAFYLANDGEINPKFALGKAFSCGANCYLPQINNPQQMAFRRVGVCAPLVKNHYGINEPALAAPQIHAKHFDVIFVPLVAFDRYGNRIGMGGGYYDRALGELKHARHKPLLVGLAHSQQEVKKIDRNVWDISLDLIITERERIV